MNTLLEELLEIQQELKSYIEETTAPPVIDVLSTVEDSAKTVGRASSGSWIGYQANVYFEDFQPPPPGRHFSSEWGFIAAQSAHTRGAWLEYDPEDVKSKIEEKANPPDVAHVEELAQKGRDLFDLKRDHIISILEASKIHHDDSFLNDMLERTKQLHIASENEIISNIRPSQVASRDSLALSQGIWTPPHISILARIASLRSPMKTNKLLSDIVEKTMSHMKRVNGKPAKTRIGGKRVFIGHGRSLLWRELKDFIYDRLKLGWEEFNRVPVAGITNIGRLSEMLDSASIAFLVMTAEDEQSDGKVRARMNVIHEAGLFQGRLGFDKAIIVLEEGCEEFSNIQGLGQIRFPQGNIRASFDEIRSILEREGVLEG